MSSRLPVQRIEKCGLQMLSRCAKPSSSIGVLVLSNRPSIRQGGLSLNLFRIDCMPTCGVSTWSSWSLSEDNIEYVCGRCRAINSARATSTGNLCSCGTSQPQCKQTNESTPVCSAHKGTTCKQARSHRYDDNRKMAARK